MDLREGVVLPGQTDLSHLELPAGGDLVAEVTDPDGADHIPAQQLQPGEEGGAHVPDGQDVDPLLPPAAGLGQDGLPAGAADVHRGEPPRLHGGGQGGVQRDIRQAGGVQHLQPVGGLQLARVGHPEGAPAQHRVPFDQIPDGCAGGGLSLGPGQVSPVGGQNLPLFFVIIEHNITLRNHFQSNSSSLRAQRLRSGSASAAPDHSPDRPRLPGLGRSSGRCPCPGTEGG